MIKTKIKVNRVQDKESSFDVTLEFHNTSEKRVYILKMGTPLEGLISDCFEVKLNGALIAYDGILIKRGAYTKKDFIAVKSGERIEHKVDLSEAYQVSAVGEYSVALKSVIYIVDSLTNINEVSIKENKFDTPVVANFRVKAFKTKMAGSLGRATLGEIARRKESLEKSKKRKSLNEKKPLDPTIKSGSSPQKAKMKTAHKDGYNLAVAAQKGLSNNSWYKEWFGKYSKTRFNKVDSVLNTLVNEMEKTVITYDLSGEGCPSNAYAYTYHGVSTVWMCDGFWSAPSTGTDSKAGTVVHELSHARAYTEDHEYGQSDCRELAKKSPNLAVGNADNYEYFCKG